MKRLASTLLLLVLAAASTNARQGEEDPPARKALARRALVETERSGEAFLAVRTPVLVTFGPLLLDMSEAAVPRYAHTRTRGREVNSLPCEHGLVCHPPSKPERGGRRALVSYAGTFDWQGAMSSIQLEVLEPTPSVGS